MDKIRDALSRGSSLRADERRTSGERKHRWSLSGRPRSASALSTPAISPPFDFKASQNQDISSKDVIYSQSTGQVPTISVLSPEGDRSTPLENTSASQHGTNVKDAPIPTMTFARKEGLELPEREMFPSEDANPCRECKKLTLNILLWHKYKMGDMGGDGVRGHLHHENWRSLERSFEAGCKFCKMIKEGLSASTDWDLLQEGFGVYLFVPVDKTFFEKRIADYAITAAMKRNLSSEEKRPYDWNKCFASCTIGLYTDRGDPAADHMPGRRLSQAAHLPTMCYEVQRWMKDVRAYTELEPDLPKRILDLSRWDPYNPILKLKIVYHSERDTQGKFQKFYLDDGILTHGYYVCLSHRWASGSHPMTTTTKNINNRIDDIPFANLTQTFKDAIALVKGIGLQYLWIDSLCILQDSQEDWEEESSKMGEYYSQSCLTIGAGLDGDGLFSKRITPSKPYCKLVLPLNDKPDSPQCNLYLSHEPHDMPIREIGGRNQSPLYSRGWTLQEEMLSKHFLSFEPTQTYFRCPTWVDFECGYRVRVNKWKNLSQQHITIKNLWVRIVEDFSSRALTLKSDKLPALSGLAQKYQDTFKDEYVAGMWKNELWKHLLWYTESPTRPADFRGPSWSWISMDGPIKYTGTQFDSSYITVLGVFTKTKGRNPLGEVEGALLTLRAVTGLVSISPNGEDWRTSDNIIPGFRSLDENLPSTVREINFVRITEKQCLLLLPIQHMKGTFKRVGIIRIGRLDETTGSKPIESVISIV